MSLSKTLYPESSRHHCQIVDYDEKIKSNKVTHSTEIILKNCTLTSDHLKQIVDFSNLLKH